MRETSPAATPAQRGRLSPWTLLLLLALILPAGSATWAFGEYAADRERDRADSHVTAMLRSARDEYNDVLRAARERASRLAALPAVQRALERKRPVQRVGSNAYLVSPDGRVPERSGAELTAEIVRDGRRVGLLTVVVPLDTALTRRLNDAAAAAPGDRVLLARPGTSLARLSAHPSDIRVGDHAYRGAAAPLAQTDTEVVALRNAAVVEDAAADVRRRVFTIGAGTVIAIALLAYGFAPLLARNRTLARQRAQAARVLSQLADGVFEIDDSGVITLWNPAAARITGLAAENLLGQRADQALPGWDAVRALRPHESEGGTPQTVPVDVEGRELWLSVSAVSTDGSIVYAFRDLTEERKLEQMRTELVATVSHELRTPLAAVYGAALTLRRSDDLDPGVRAELLKLIAQHSEWLARIVDQMLLAGQMSSTHVPISEGVFDVTETVSGAVDDARSHAPDGLRIAWQRNGPVTARADAERVRQVVANLLDNAVKYSNAEGGTVEVSVEAAADVVRVVVRDDGLGIPEAEQEHIFEKFYRLDPQMSRGVGGTGLGLYIARQLAERMGGRLALQSRLGAGSTFTLELPRPTDA